MLALRLTMQYNFNSVELAFINFIESYTGDNSVCEVIQFNYSYKFIHVRYCYVSYAYHTSMQIILQLKQKQVFGTDICVLLKKISKKKRKILLSLFCVFKFTLQLIFSMVPKQQEVVEDLYELTLPDTPLIIVSVRRLRPRVRETGDPS